MADLIQVKNLQTSFFTPEGEVRAIDGVSFAIAEGKTLGLVGESGCGKSVTSLSIMRLIASPPGKIVGGEILYRGRDLLKLDNEEMRKIRGNEISMIFQEPMTSLNPVFTVGNQIGEAIKLHQGLGKKATRAKTIEMLRLVKIADPEARVDAYPHQLSGGMRQRIMIAMALSCNPSLLIADEPTTALDVTIQAQILELMKELQQQIGMALLLITHDLGVVAEQADDVAIMYAGKPASLYHRFDEFAARHGRREEKTVGGDSRHGAEPAPFAERLPLPRPLSKSRRRLRRKRAGTCGERARTWRRLPFPGMRALPRMQNAECKMKNAK